MQSIDQLSISTLRKHAITLGKKMKDSFESEKENSYNIKDEPTLKTITYTVGDKDFLISYGSINEDQIQVGAIVHAMDKGQISREAYQELANTIPELPREWLVSNTKKNINNELNN